MDIYGINGDSSTHEHVEWMYPEIYDRSKQSTLTIGLCHTRAADDIRIKYDSERDGWVIEQASTFKWSCDDLVCDSDWKEVAFVQAWAREKNKEENTNSSQQA
jgi:hypothetical protein